MRLLLKNRVRSELYFQWGFNACQSCTVSVFMWCWPGIGDAGNVHLQVLRDHAKQICDSSAVILVDRGGCWVTDWARVDCGSLSTGCPAPLMSAHCGTPTVGAFIRPCLFHITLADHPILIKCPGRFTFSQECGPSEHPPAHLDPS